MPKLSSVSSAGGVGARFDYVSPLPPVRSGIADYSVDLLRAVGGSNSDVRLDMRVVRVKGQELDSGLVDSLSPVSFDRLGEDGRIPVYHLGNNPYHEAIYDVAMQRPGVVVLHDVFLHHLLQERTLAKTDVGAYVEQLAQDHGWIGQAVAQPPRWGGYGRAALFALPAHRALLERQRGVIVHSEWARHFLREEGVSRPIIRVPMVMPLPDLDDVLGQRVDALRSEWGVGADAFVVGSFGFQTPIKRTSTAIRALAQPGLSAVELIVAGDATKGVDLAGDAARHGVSDRVHLVGFLESDEFSAAIRACDLTVNLRYPTAGETSASLLRILALGRAAIVSDYAQFRDIDRSFALRVGLGNDPLDDAASSEEVLSLAAQLRALVSDRERVAEMGLAARRFVQNEHAPPIAGRAFVEAVAELAAQPLPSEIEVAATASDPWARTPSTLTWGKLESTLKVRGVDGWRPGELRTIELEIENRSHATFLAAKRGAGGVMFEIQLTSGTTSVSQTDCLADQPWLGLPRDVLPGDSLVLRHQLRRPLGRTQLRIEPHVVGAQGFSRCGGATYSRTFD